ncbi:hypothetical protein I656_02523 [Geobacillus sp. WSUCF1]|nr:hypothetical protein I656_02523 [Geobacillus sp. WSUCF1]
MKGIIHRFMTSSRIGQGFHQYMHCKEHLCMNFLMLVYDEKYTVQTMQGDDDGETDAQTPGVPSPS